MPFAALGAAAAAIVAAIAIMVKGGMIERPAFAGGAPDQTAGGSASGIGELGADGELDPFKRFPRDRSSAPGGPEPTQTETGMLANDTWGTDDGGSNEPAVSYDSPGDAQRTPVPTSPENPYGVGGSHPGGQVPTTPENPYGVGGSHPGGQVPAPTPPPLVTTGGGSGRSVAV